MWPSVIGALAAGAVFGSFLFTDPLRAAPAITGPFSPRHDYRAYDNQAHSLLHLRWNVPTGSFGYEAFLVHGRSYEYFGPFPALLRLPLAALTTQFDGRLGPASMLLAFAVLMFFTARLAARLRALVPGPAITRGELWAVGVFTFVVGGGSAVVFLASRTWVYHEAALWAAALSLASFDYIIAFTTDLGAKNLFLASAFAAAALLTRGAAGLGPLLALAILFVFIAFQRGHNVVGLPEQQPISARFRAACAAAVVVPLSLYSAVNYAKFGSLVSVPWKAQLSANFANSVATTARNNGSRLGLVFVPENVVQYLRPTAIRFSSLFPWWTFEPLPRHQTITQYSPSSSLTVMMPAFCVLAVIGIVGSIGGARAFGSKLAALRAPILGSCGAAAGTLAFGFIANRYMVDFVPVLVVASLAGLHLMLRWSPTASTQVRRLAWVAIAALAAFGTWTSLSLTVVYARLVEPKTPLSTRASFHKFQRSVGDLLADVSQPKVVVVCSLLLLVSVAVVVLRRAHRRDEMAYEST
jgi:hypothetical protein